MIIFVTITGERVIICTEFHIFVQQVSTKHSRFRTKGFKGNKGKEPPWTMQSSERDKWTYRKAECPGAHRQIQNTLGIQKEKESFWKRGWVGAFEFELWRVQKTLRSRVWGQHSRWRQEWAKAPKWGKSSEQASYSVWLEIKLARWVYQLRFFELQVIKVCLKQAQVVRKYIPYLEVQRGTGTPRTVWSGLHVCFSVLLLVLLCSVFTLPWW